MKNRTNVFVFTILMLVGNQFVASDFYISQFMLKNDDMPNDIFSEIESNAIQSPCDGCKWSKMKKIN